MTSRVAVVPANSSFAVPCPRGNYCPANSTGAGLPQCPTGSFGNVSQASVVQIDSNAPPYRRLIQERFNMVRARADVRAAAETVGRIEVLPVHLRSGY